MLYTIIANCEDTESRVLSVQLTLQTDRPIRKAPPPRHTSQYSVVNNLFFVDHTDKFAVSNHLDMFWRFGSYYVITIYQTFNRGHVHCQRSICLSIISTYQV